VPAKKLVVSIYLQYALVGAVALLLFASVRRLGGVLLTFLLAGVLAYVLNPPVRWLEGSGIPRVRRAWLVRRARRGGPGRALRPHRLGGGAGRGPDPEPPGPHRRRGGDSDRIRETPYYVGERVAALGQEALHGFARANAPSAGRVYNGALDFIGGVFETVLNLGLMLIISIYLVLDRERVTRAMMGLSPRRSATRPPNLFTPSRARS
jgi:predicted PurR-regulated permease PerM